MEIRYQGKIEPADFRKATAIHFQPSKLSLVIRVILLVVIIVSFGYVISTQPQLWSTVLIGFFIPSGVLTLPWWYPYLVASSYNQPANIYQSPIKGVIDDVGITILGKNTQTNLKWDAIKKQKRSGDLILLYQSKNCFNIFTRSLFASEAEWDAFVEAVTSKIVMH